MAKLVYLVEYWWNVIRFDTKTFQPHKFAKQIVRGAVVKRLTHLFAKQAYTGSNPVRAS